MTDRIRDTQLLAQELVTLGLHHDDTTVDQVLLNLEPADLAALCGVLLAYVEHVNAELADARGVPERDAWRALVLGLTAWREGVEP